MPPCWGERSETRWGQRSNSGPSTASAPTFRTGLTDLPRHDGLSGAITDDTQMTLFTAEGVIRAAVRYACKGICHPPSVVHHALLRWLVTQGERPRLAVDTSGLVADRRLHRRRAPGLHLPLRPRRFRELRRASPKQLQRLRHDHACRAAGLSRSRPGPRARHRDLRVDPWAPDRAAGRRRLGAGPRCARRRRRHRSRRDLLPRQLRARDRLRAPSRARCAARRPPRNRRDPGRRLDRRRGAVDRALRLPLRHPIPSRVDHRRDAFGGQRQHRSDRRQCPRPDLPGPGPRAPLGEHRWNARI